jgi:hypothetical protein
MGYGDISASEGPNGMWANCVKAEINGVGWGACGSQRRVIGGFDFWMRGIVSAMNSPGYYYSGVLLQELVNLLVGRGANIALLGQITIALFGQMSARSRAHMLCG